MNKNWSRNGFLYDLAKSKTLILNIFWGEIIDFFKRSNSIIYFHFVFNLCAAVREGKFLGKKGPNV